MTARQPTYDRLPSSFKCCHLRTMGYITFAFYHLMMVISTIRIHCETADITHHVPGHGYLTGIVRACDVQVLMPSRMGCETCHLGHRHPLRVQLATVRRRAILPRMPGVTEFCDPGLARSHSHHVQVRAAPSRRFFVAMHGVAAWSNGCAGYLR